MRNKWNKWLCGIDERVKYTSYEMEVHAPRNSNSRGTSYEDIARKWFTLMPLHAYRLSHYDNEGGYQLQLKYLRSEFNYRYNKNQYWWDWFCQNYPIWTVLVKGNEYKGNTRAMIHPDKDLVMSVLSPEEVVEVYNAEKNADLAVDYIDIDLDNLRRFLKLSEHNVIAKRNVGNAYINKIKRNITDAKRIIKLAEGLNDTVVNPLTGELRYKIPQPYSISPFGRKYYTSQFSLQNKSPELRQAALGRCWSIDIDSSVFRFYKMLAVDLGIEHSVLDILLANKAAFRNELAMCLENISTDTVYLSGLVKEAITAMGFGARDTSYWDPSKQQVKGALADIIKNTEDRDRLTSHEYWLGLKLVYNTIKNQITSNKQFVDSYKNDPVFWQRNKYTADRLMSLLYQQYEAGLMDKVINLLDACEREPRLWVHDGVYTLLNPMKHGEMHAIESIIQEEINPYIKFEIKECPEIIIQFTEEIKTEETEHKRNIGVEEMLAKQWAYDNQFINDGLDAKERLRALRLRNPESVENSEGAETNLGYYDGSKKLDDEYMAEYLAEFYGEDQ